MCVLRPPSSRRRGICGLGCRSFRRGCLFFEDSTTPSRAGPRKRSITLIVLVSSVVGSGTPPLSPCPSGHGGHLREDCPRGGVPVPPRRQQGLRSWSSPRPNLGSSAGSPRRLLRFGLPSVDVDDLREMWFFPVPPLSNRPSTAPPHLRPQPCQTN